MEHFKSLVTSKTGSFIHNLFSAIFPVGSDFYAMWQEKLQLVLFTGLDSSETVTTHNLKLKSSPNKIAYSSAAIDGET